MKISQKYTDRFWSKVDKTGDCWEWTDGKFITGYGAFGISGYAHYAHRMSWMLTHGSIPSGLFVLHKCDNPGCVNPEHLFLGTQADNMKDMSSKKREIHPRGEDLPSSKLTEKQVLEIRSKYIPWKYTMAKLAKEYNVTDMAIHSVISRTTWSHI